MRTLRPLIVAAAILLSTLAFAQIVQVKRGSADYKAIVRVVTPFANQHAVSPVTIRGDVVRRSGNWAFVLSRLDFVDGKTIGDGDLMAVLKKKNGKWILKEAAVGSGGMEDLAEDWRKKHHLPKGLVTDRA